MCTIDLSLMPILCKHLHWVYGGQLPVHADMHNAVPL